MDTEELKLEEETGHREDYERFPRFKRRPSDSDYVPSESEEQRNSEDISSETPESSEL